MRGIKEELHKSGEPKQLCGSLNHTFVIIPWINDVDVGIYCPWKAVRDHPDLLQERIWNFTPSFKAFNQLKACLRSSPIGACDHDIVHVGFCKLALHCLSYSSIGLNGGPKSGYGDRECCTEWAPQYLADKVEALRNHISHIRITKIDYKALIVDQSSLALLYVDPPYFNTGSRLYAHSFKNLRDHALLAQTLRQTSHHWVLSYDDCPEIRNLYDGWADVERLPVIYTIRNRASATELLISSR